MADDKDKALVFNRDGGCYQL